MCVCRVHCQRRAAVGSQDAPERILPLGAAIPYALSRRGNVSFSTRTRLSISIIMCMCEQMSVCNALYSMTQCVQDINVYYVQLTHFCLHHGSQPNERERRKKTPKSSSSPTTNDDTCADRGEHRKTHTHTNNVKCVQLYKTH